MSQLDFDGLVAAEVRGEPPAGGLEILRADPLRWREQLVVMKQQIEADLATVRADSLVRQQQCLSRGIGDNRGRDTWYNFKAKQEQRRAALGRVKQRVEKRLSDLKVARATAVAEGYTARAAGADFASAERLASDPEWALTESLLAWADKHEATAEQRASFPALVDALARRLVAIKLGQARKLRIEYDAREATLRDEATAAGAQLAQSQERITALQREGLDARQAEYAERRRADGLERDLRAERLETDRLRRECMQLREAARQRNVAASAAETNGGVQP